MEMVKNMKDNGKKEKDKELDATEIGKETSFGKDHGKMTKLLLSIDFY